MPASVPSVRRCSLLVAASLLIAIPTAHAQRVSARDKARVEAIEQRMAAAEKRYADALLLVANADPKPCCWLPTPTPRAPPRATPRWRTWRT